MKSTLIMLCILGTSLAGSAQDKSFDLSKYKFPDFKRHELEFNFNSSGQSSNWNGNRNNYETGSWDTVQYKNLEDYTIFSLNYNYIHNTRKKQLSINSNFNSSYRFSKYSTDEETTFYHSPLANFSIYADQKYYLTENKWFLEISPGFESEIWSTNEKYFTSEVVYSKQRGNSFSAQFGLGGGIGRIENITEFWQAYYILEGLNKQGSLLREPSEKDIYELATLASQLKSKRFFDSRLKKIDEMKSIDSLMHKTNLIDKSDIYYFNTLNDYWNFANISNRSSGRVLKVLMTPEVSHRFFKELGKLEHTTNETHLNTQIDFQCYKQLNLFWERILNVNFINQTTLDDDSEHLIRNYPNNLFQFNSGIGWNFYPNFRTSFNSGLSYQASQFVGELNPQDIKYVKEWSNNVGLHSSVYYYLSPQLRFEGNINASHSDNKQFSTRRDWLSISYSLGFRYAIF